MTNFELALFYRAENDDSFLAKPLPEPKIEQWQGDAVAKLRAIDQSLFFQAG
ncbi:hypothetical protein [Leptolyngbya sp. KIOST-1]|uniref:hypothetical protein n=1 Tax=Leptolyngbya sp. KIOST-1 TaxID=1229172 RepID=UPI000A79A8D4|nr:hypothetical protein [Leptolyngbya sp. KIOST-1]